MTTVHPLFQFFGGDDWEIHATLLDEHGNPYDLSGTPEIKWTLLDSNLQQVVEAGEAAISILDPLAGECVIQVPGTVTTRLGGGQYYSDAIRIVIGGVTSTLATGRVLILADPWAAQTAAASAVRAPTRQRLVTVK